MATTYYIDLDSGDDAAVGTAIGTAWLTLGKFCSNVRVAGDKAIVRRGTTETAAAQVAFESDGTKILPIILEADYDNAWSDFSNSAQTYTVALGSKTMTASATITGISAGDWIYVTGDTSRDFAYEVASISGTTLTLYLPYKGNTSGTVKTLVRMPPAPIWNDTSGAYYFNLYSDWYWIIQGLSLKGSTYPVYNYNSYTLFKDCVFQGGITSYGIYSLYNVLFIEKCRWYNTKYGCYLDHSIIYVEDCYMDMNSIASSIAVYSTFNLNSAYLKDVQIVTCAYLFNSVYGFKTYCINVQGPALLAAHATNNNESYIDDYNGTIGSCGMYTHLNSANAVPITGRETTTIRSGGGSTSIKVTPYTYVGSLHPSGKVKLFEFPIETTTDSKTYTIYFKSNNTTDWTANPTATELYIELDAYCNASATWRKVNKSTGTLNFTGSTDWQTLTVTVAPAVAGISILRGWYKKTKETGVSNILYVDTKPVIS